MKKLVSLFLVLCMMCAVIPALAEEDLTGEWYAGLYGTEITLALGEDGSAKMLIGDMEMIGQGTWALEDGKLIITDTESGESSEYDYADGKISVDNDGEHMEFTREHAETIDLADINIEATAEDFEGTWNATYAMASGLLVDASVAGMDGCGVNIENSTISFFGEDDSVTFFFGEDPLQLAFEDGALHYAIELPNGDETMPASLIVNMLQDGMLYLNMDIGYGDIAIIYTKAATEEPAA